MTDEETDILIEQAVSARESAYAPYSRFKVGAALRTKSGRVFTGVNVESISYGLTLCAERVCVGSAITAGETAFEAVAIVSNSEQPVMPCGACRQVLAEFAPELMVISATTAGGIERSSLDVLLPKSRQGILG